MCVCSSLTLLINQISIAGSLGVVQHHVFSSLSRDYVNIAPV